MLARLARFSFRRRKLMVFGIWLPLLILINIVAGGVGTDYHTEFNQPDSESKRVQEAFINTGNKEDAGFPASIVFVSDDNSAPAVQDAMTQFLGEVDSLEGVKVVSPYSDSPGAAGLRSESDSPANKLGKDVYFARLTVSERDQAATQKLADQVTEIGDKINVPGLQIEYGGQVFQKFEFPASELLGILAAIIILLIAFGSVIAMGLPIGTAVIGLGVGMAIVGIASNGFSIPEFGPQMTAMIGLGVGIDYALFIVSRYREHLHAGEDPETATIAAVDSSGRAVIFAGITVMISLLGLFIMGLSFVRGLAIAGATGVLVMMIASITLLPALLGFTGKKIDNTSRAAAIGAGLFVLIGLIAVAADQIAMVGLGALLWIAIVGISYIPGAKSLRTPLPHRQEKPRELRFWFKWSRKIQRRPWPYFAGGAGVLILLALPLFSIRLGFSDEGNAAKDTTVRKAYDTLAGAFGPGTNGPLFLVSTDPAADTTKAAAVDAALAADPEVQFATPGTDIGNGTWSWTVFPKSAPQDEATSDLVHRLRDDVLPTTGIKVDVGGFTAGGIDFATYLGGRLPLLIGAVLVLSFLLLLAVFRSILVPLKAVIMNLLSVGAAYGIIVAIFQWGWGLGLIGVDKAGPVEAWAPMMLFAIVFGLSMDYEVFLLSRMKEEFDRTGDNGTAVADGLAVTARVITAAAVIMVCVFAAFVLGDDRSLKLFGLGMAVAVLVDATVVRMVLVPATMELLGARNWWIPKWLDKVLPRIDVEGHSNDPTLEPEREPELV